MATLVLVSIWAAIMACMAYRYMFHRPPNFPPGPPRIPWFGSYLFLLLLDYKYLHKAVGKLCRYYKSNVIGLYHGPVLLVVCNDLPSIREALLNPVLDGKPDILLTQLREKEFKTKGLFFTDGKLWQDNRRFTLRHLRDFGYARRFPSFELDVETELQDFVDLIRNGAEYPHEKIIVKSGGGLAFCPKMFYIVTGNSFMKLFCNQVIPRSEQGTYLDGGSYAKDFTTFSCGFGKLFSLVPFVRELFPIASGFKLSRDSSMGLYYFVEKIVKRELSTYNETNERHFLDLYFTEMKTNNPDNNLSIEQLVLIGVDMFLATFATLSTSMSYLVYQWIVQPETLKRVQIEIDEVVGRGRLPTLSDRVNLNYLEASLRETMRLYTTIPSGFAHRALEDTKVAGYNVPMNTFVVTNLQVAHWNDDSFANAMQFKPERFLDANGKLSLKADTSLPFGAGKRLCAGETFSRNTMFLIAGALAQNFDASKDPDRPLPDLRESVTGIANHPPDFWVKFEER